tara:strand:+ start:90 stop:344 length:255 start_codon:yes stop_codon:yes gene_type:complete
MNKEQFEKKAEELFKKYSYQGVHGGDLVIGENAFDYLIEQLHEALTIPVVTQRSELLLFADYSESDKVSQTTDECVDNYLDQKQ